jgi:GDP-4-dehydro-6-deoxy-D-mannose reductase
MASPRIVVTGAGGFAGGHLLDLLTAIGADVFAWSGPRIPSQEAREPEHPHVTWRVVDLLDVATLDAGLAEDRPTEIYHLAGAAHVGSSWREPTLPLAVNTLGTHHLLQGVRRIGIRPRVLVAGSAAVYRSSSTALSESSPLAPTSPYAISKLAQERVGTIAAECDGLDVLITRPFNHVGPRQSPEFVVSGFARQLAQIEAGLAEPVLRVGNLDASRDLTDVRDTVRAYAAVMARGEPRRPYNICSGRPYRIGDILERLLALTKRQVEVTVDTERLRPNDTPVLQGDGSRIEREIGWTPRIPLEQTLEETLDYWRSVVTRGE